MSLGVATGPLLFASRAAEAFAALARNAPGSLRPVHCLLYAELARRVCYRDSFTHCAFVATTVETMAHRTLLEPSTVRRACARLERAGWIRVVAELRNGRKLFCVFLQPLPDDRLRSVLPEIADLLAPFDTAPAAEGAAEPWQEEQLFARLREAVNGSSGQGGDA